LWLEGVHSIVPVGTASYGRNSKERCFLYSHDYFCIVGQESAKDFSVPTGNLAGGPTHQQTSLTR